MRSSWPEQRGSPACRRLPRQQHQQVRDPRVTPPASRRRRSLPKSYWADTIAEFEKVRINGQPREFPSHLLLGAEEVLARMFHEHQVSKLYTPVRLGELIAVRHITPTKQVNPFAKNEEKQEKVLLRRAASFANPAQYQKHRRFSRCPMPWKA